MQDDFWNQLSQLVVSSEVIIDQPSGSAHPHYPDMIYPFNYGYLAQSTSMDGNGIDVWVGHSGIHAEVTGLICTVDLVKRDSEIKICIGCAREEMTVITQFREPHSFGCLLIEHKSQ